MMGIHGEVLGIDVDIRTHNRKAIESHSMSKRITMIEGSSIDKAVVDEVYAKAGLHKIIMLVLDSNHTEEHVLQELRLYSDLVTKGSYLVVFDTIIEFMPRNFYANRPWNVGNNPYTALQKFLRENRRFVVDEQISGKLLLTCAPSGYLKCEG